LGIRKIIQKIIGVFGYKLLKQDRNFDSIHKNIFDTIYPPSSELIFFDIGAHKGESIDRFLGLSNNRARIYSFEAAKPLYKELARKYAEYSNVKILNLALGAKNGKLRFNFHTKSTGSSSVLKYVENTRFSERRNLSGNVKTYSVKSIRLDSFILSNPNITKINLLKIDVQGFEENVLKGMAWILKKIIGRCFGD
jgi:FkbM family methyltransferase